ncbi:TLDc domain-containing protein [Entamoeba marina]
MWCLSILVEDRTHLVVDSSESKLKKDTNTPNSNINCVEILSRFTNFQHFDIIFDSDLQPYNVTCFQRCLYGRKNVAIIYITVNDYIYGCLNTTTIPQILQSEHTEQKKWVKQTKDNPRSTESFRIFKENVDMYISADAFAFGIWKQQLYDPQSLYIYFGIADYFENEPTHLQLIGKKQNGAYDNSYTSAKRVLCVQCYN